jgi:hypothetical protein
MANRTQFIVRDDLVRKKWLNLERLAAGSGADPANVEAQRAFLDQLFLGCNGITVTHPVTAIFRGSSEWAFSDFELYCEINDERRPFLEALNVHASEEAFVEAVYITMHLRTRFLPWHAVYGGDYAFLFNEEGVWTHGAAIRRGELEEIKRKVDRPFGIRVSKRTERYYISCLTAYSSGKIIDRVIRLEGGRIMELSPPDVLCPPRINLIY